MNFSRRIGDVSSINSIAAAVSSLSAGGLGILNLSDSNPTKHGLSYIGYAKTLAARGTETYEPDPRGALAARIALSACFGGDPLSYFLTASTSESYSWLFKLLCDPGDAIAVPKPGYPLFEHLAGLESVTTVPYELSYDHRAGWSIDVENLEHALGNGRVKAVVAINPNNPTGSYVSEDEGRRIGELCGRFGAALIADEVFYPYSVEETSPPPRLSWQSSCLAFSLDGLSKLLGLPQAKLGWFRVSGPPDLAAEAAARLELIADTYLSVSGPAMNSLPALLDGADRHIQMVRARLSENLSVLRGIFDGEYSAYRILRCQGGWTALLEYPRYYPEERVVLSLLERSAVLVQPGHFFDFKRDGFLSFSLILEPRILSSGAAMVREGIDALGR